MVFHVQLEQTHSELAHGLNDDYGDATCPRGAWGSSTLRGPLYRRWMALCDFADAPDAVRNGLINKLDNWPGSIRQVWCFVVCVCFVFVVHIFIFFYDYFRAQMRIKTADAAIFAKHDGRPPGFKEACLMAGTTVNGVRHPFNCVMSVHHLYVCVDCVYIIM